MVECLETKNPCLYNSKRRDRIPELNSFMKSKDDQVVQKPHQVGESRANGRPS